MQKNSKKSTRFHIPMAIGVAVSFLFAAFAGTAHAAPPDSLLSRLGDTQTFYSQFIIAGGPIVWFILLPMSVVMLYLAIVLCATITRKKLLPPNITVEIATNAAKFTPHRLTDSLSNAKDLVSSSLCQALTKAKLLNADPKQITLLAAESLQHRTLHMMRKAEACHTISNVAPMVGLFGTVFGMIRAFNLLSVSGSQPPPDQLAAAISIALITTFWGLLVAIPAYAIYGIFRTRIETIATEAAIEIQTLIRQITFPPLTEKPHPQPIPTIRPARQSPRRTAATQTKSNPAKPVTANTGFAKNAGNPRRK